METSPHRSPLPEDTRVQCTRKNPQPTYDGPNPSTGAARPPPSTLWTPTSISSPLLKLLSRRDVLHCLSTAKRAHSIRIRANKRQPQPMLTDHWPDLRPASLMVYHRKPAPPPPLPRSLPNLGWKRDPSYRIRLEPPQGAPFPFSLSPPSSPPQLRPDPLPPDHDKHMSTSPKASLDGITHASDLADLPTSP